MLKIRQKATPRQRRNAPLRFALRESSGVYLVEILVAIMIGSMILMTLTSMLGTTLQLGTRGQNEVYAQETLNELLEYTRGVGYAFLDANRGNHTLLTNKLQTSDVGPAVRSLPVQLNFVAQEWKPSTANAKFQGVVRYNIEEGPVLNTLKVTITVAWSNTFAPGAESQGRTISASTIITKDGTDKYTSSDMLEP